MAAHAPAVAAGSGRAARGTGSSSRTWRRGGASRSGRGLETIGMAKEYRTEKYKLTDDELKNVEIVLSDALPYELAMLEAAARYMEDEAFAKLPVDTDCIAGLTRNAIIECFWTHARCLIEFFNRTENNNKYTASAASVKDLTKADYWPSGDMEKLSEKHKEDGATPICTQINEQISHVGFCRKTEQWNKLSAERMRDVKAKINKETERFSQKLRPEFRHYWKWKNNNPAVMNVADQAMTTTNAIIATTLILGNR
jgi:hypothetical protein